MDCLIKNADIISSTRRFRGSVGIHNGRIAGIYTDGAEPAAGQVIDAQGKALIPGFIDMHCHHREGSEPGFEYKETIRTATMAAAAGGVTTAVGMPNVVPPPNAAGLLRAWGRCGSFPWMRSPAPTLRGGGNACR